jgi:hypothetical protein
MPDLQIADSLEVVLAKDLASVPQVRYILIEWNDGPLIVWIAVDDPEPSVRRLIYQKELGLIEGFPETKFDFNLIPTMGRDADELATGARLIYSRQG